VTYVSTLVVATYVLVKPVPKIPVLIAVRPELATTVSVPLAVCDELSLTDAFDEIVVPSIAVDETIVLPSLRPLPPSSLAS
jgi:hypothetical protein